MASNPDPDSIALKKAVQRLDQAKINLDKAKKEYAIADRRLDELFERMEKKHGPKKGKRWTSKTLVPGD